MIRGTTPTIKFKILNIQISDIAEAEIDFGQRGYLILTKANAECTRGTNSISCSLSQQDTLLFDHEVMLEIQLKIKTINGNVLATPVYKKDVKKILNEEVL